MGLSLMGWVMLVSPFVRDAVYDPEIIKVMVGAYEELLGDLELTKSAKPPPMAGRKPAVRQLRE
jgi:hypothetical protein